MSWGLSEAAKHVKESAQGLTGGMEGSRCPCPSQEALVSIPQVVYAFAPLAILLKRFREKPCGQQTFVHFYFLPSVSFTSTSSKLDTPSYKLS